MHARAGCLCGGCYPWVFTINTKQLNNTLKDRHVLR